VERVSELETRIAVTAPSWSRLVRQLSGIVEERAQQHSFWRRLLRGTAFRQQVEARQQEARKAAEEVFTAERESGNQPPPETHLLTLAATPQPHDPH